MIRTALLPIPKVILLPVRGAEDVVAEQVHAYDEGGLQSPPVSEQSEEEPSKLTQKGPSSTCLKARYLAYEAVSICFAAYIKAQRHT